ncbi:MAG: putative replication-associated protein [CRESS virus sp. cta0f7]|uniref:Putative replication-associated protein n=1 Tax=CRESS virus sp. cta0f7 TaxID=2656680 RepID=A0A5Q2W3Z7_9VIRU|nr:MAG: putative replication-associated protein [CRESS virus sp. cta0f7]
MTCPQEAPRRSRPRRSPLSPLSPTLVEGRGSFGSAPLVSRRCLTCAVYGSENCPPLLCGYVGNRSLESLGDISIGNSVSRSPRRCLWPPSRESLAEVSMRSSQGVSTPPVIVARRLQELQVHGSGEVDPFAETSRLTGTQYGPPPSPELLAPSRVRFEYLITATLDVLDPIIWRLEQYFVRSAFTGARVELANLAEPGMKAEWMLTASVLDPSSGMDTQIRRLLSSMNFVVESTSLISSDGVTGIQYALKSKDRRDHWWLSESSLLQM